MDNDNSTIACKTCGEIVTSNYCSNCGEKNVTPRISFKNFISEILSETLSFEAPVLYTIKQIIKGPGKVPARYIAGNRKVFTKPFAFFFLMVGVYYVLSQLVIDPEALIQIINENISESFKAIPQYANSNIEKMAADASLLQEKMKELNFLSLPFISLFSWLFFKKSGYNLLENIVLFLYTNGIIIFLSLINVLFCIISLKAIFYTGPIINILSIVYIVWGQVQFHNQKTLWGVVKAILAYLLSMAIFSISFAYFYDFF